MPKRISILIITLIALFILLNLGKQISEAVNVGKRLDKAADEVYKLQEDNKRLHQKLTDSQKYDIIEEIARNKLNMAKPGETIIIIPNDQINKVLSQNRPIQEAKLEFYQGWLRLFFH